MDSKEQEIGRIKYLIDKLRSITLTVQVIPFASTLLYILILCAYPFCADSVLNVLDTLFYVSPIVIFLTLIESRILRLCKWHKLACMLPLIPQIWVFIDQHIIRLTITETIVHYITILVMCILLLIAAYNVFLK